MNRRDFLLRLGALAPGLILVPWVPKIMVPVAKIQARPGVPFYVNGKEAIWYPHRNFIRLDHKYWEVHDLVKMFQYLPDDVQELCRQRANIHTLDPTLFRNFHLAHEILIPSGRYTK